MINFSQTKGLITRASVRWEAIQETEQHEGGLVFPRLIDPSVAAVLGERILVCFETNPELFYTPPIEGEPNYGVHKIWLHNTVAGNSGRIDLIHPELAQDMRRLAMLVDTATRTPSVDRFALIYEQDVNMRKHSDQGAPSRSVDLLGSATIQFHDPQTSAIIDRALATPGDVIALDDRIEHSIDNSGAGPRVMIGLIDYY